MLFLPHQPNRAATHLTKVCQAEGRFSIARLMYQTNGLLHKRWTWLRPPRGICQPLKWQARAHRL